MNIQNDIRDTLEYYIQKAPRIDSGYKQKLRIANTELVPLLILLKYQNYCNIINLDLTDINPIFGVFLINELSSSQIDEICNNFKKCLDSGSNIISFRVRISQLLTDYNGTPNTSSHANVMIYKSNINTFQYFEPHGSNFQEDEIYTEYISDILDKLFKEMETRQLIPSNWTYDSSEATCPTPKGKGFQTYEGSLASKCYGKENTLGFCVSWSNFILEMYLKYSYLNIKDILYYAIKGLGLNSDNCAFQKFIVSYDTENFDYLSGFLQNKYTDKELSDDYSLIKEIEKELIDKYFSDGKEPQAPIQKYIQEKKYKQAGTCVNIKTGTVNDIVQYILATPDNIVISVDDFIGCYKRSDIIGDINDYKFTEINNIRVEFPEESSGNLSPIRKLNKNEKVNILHKNIEYNRIYPDMYVSNEDLKKIKDFNNVFFNFILQYENFYPTIYKVYAFTLEKYLMEEEPL